MYNKNTMKKGVKLVYILVFFMLAIFLPVLVLANTANSERYNITDQVDYSGGAVSSENYQVFGMLTDMSQVVFWPQVSADSEGTSSGIPISAGPITESIELAPIDASTIMVEDVLQVNVLGNLNLADLADKINIPLVTTGLILTIGIALLSQLFGGIALMSPLSSLWASFLAFFGFGKKKGRWGMVYDAETGIPIAMAVVQIFDQEYNKLLATQTTDKEGRFNFFVDPGKYYIKVIKSNYIFPSISTSDGYHGTPFYIGEKQDIMYKIPLDPIHKVLIHRIDLLSGIIKLLNVVRIPIIIAGTIFASIALYIDRSMLNYAVMCLYFLVWMIELYKLRKARPYGLTKEKATSELVDRAILRLFNDNNKLISTQVSDDHGRFSFLTNPGKYQITAIKTDYDMYKSNELSFSKSGKINLDVPMNKKQPKIKIIPTVYEPSVESPSQEKILPEKDDSMHPSWV